mgnify:FL=1
MHASTNTLTEFVPPSSQHDVTDYRNNHYVPQWYQKRFLGQVGGERKFFYLDLRPDRVTSGKRSHTRNALLRWGPKRCFVERDLYTTRLGTWQAVDIEKHFFGRIDANGSRAAVEYFGTFSHPSVDQSALESMMRYMTLQRLRTPKGLTRLAEMARMQDKNAVLQAMQELQNMYGAMWTESVWSIADASGSPTKFIVSDHPVTVYNKACFPGSPTCRGAGDPEVWWSGTHTIFPLSAEKLLILTNLSWVRNPYGSPLEAWPNPRLFRSAIFNFLSIQTGRELAEEELWAINHVIKQRAYRYIAAAEEDWLYPEKYLSPLWWDKLGKGYLFMPDPRSVGFTTGIRAGFEDGQVSAWDEYGRTPRESGFRDSGGRDQEWRTFRAFQGEFARLFGPKRRGLTYSYGGLDRAEDTPDLHASYLRAEKHYKSAGDPKAEEVILCRSDRSGTDRRHVTFA